MKFPALLDRVQWLKRVRRDGRDVWEPFGALRACRVRTLQQRETDDTLQDRNVATHRITQWHQSGLIPNASRAQVQEANGRPVYELELVRFAQSDPERRFLYLDCRHAAPGNPVT